jgi:hypothetical protein
VFIACSQLEKLRANLLGIRQKPDTSALRLTERRKRPKYTSLRKRSVGCRISSTTVYGITN